MAEFYLAGNPDKFSSDKLLENCAYHAATDFPNTILLQIMVPSSGKQYVVKSTTLSSIPPGSIYFSFPFRSLFNLEIGSKVVADRYVPKDTSVKKIDAVIKLSKAGKSITQHEDNLIQAIKKYLYGFYFHGTQAYLIKLEGQNVLVTTVAQGEGFYVQPEINVISSDENIRIIKSTFLRPEMFSPDFSFRDFGLGGLDSELRKIFIETLSTRAIPDSLIRMLDIKHVKGILLYGPPGTGKTLIARQIGNILTIDEPTIINGPEVVSSFVGGSAENIRKIFAQAIADQAIGSTKLHFFIFDEIDAICRSRSSSSSTSSSVNDSMVNQLLSIIDGVKSLNNIFIIAMTNRKELLDPALLRPGRIEVHIKIALPDLVGRVDILRIHTKKFYDNNMLSNINIQEIAENTENFSGAELEGLVKKSISYAINEQVIRKKDMITKDDIVITMRHFHKALSELTPQHGFDKLSIKRKSDKLIILPSIQEKLGIIGNFLKYSEHLQNQSMIIYGEKGVGKTSFVNLIATSFDIPYTKIISAVNFITLSDQSKIEFLFNIVAEAELSLRSLIIIDDVEIFLDYSRANGHLYYSVKLFNALKAVLKYVVGAEKNIRIVVTTSDISLSNELKEEFDKEMELESLSREDYETIVSKFKINDSRILGNDVKAGTLGNCHTIKAMFEARYILTIKNLLQHVC